DRIHAVAQSGERLLRDALLSKPLAGKRILLVDDSEDIRAIYSAAFALNGATVVTASDGQECLIKVEAQSFHAIVMDIQMPNMDGLAASRCLRSKGCAIPILALTSFHSKVNYDLCIAAGFDERISKPIDPVALVAELEQLIMA